MTRSRLGARIDNHAGSSRPPTLDRRFWMAAAVGTIASLLLLGIPSAVIPNPLFIRMTTTEPFNVIVWLASAPLAGFLLATSSRGAGRPPRTPMPTPAPPGPPPAASRRTSRSAVQSATRSSWPRSGSPVRSTCTPHCNPSSGPSRLLSSPAPSFGVSGCALANVPGARSIPARPARRPCSVEGPEVGPFKAHRWYTPGEY